MSFASDLQQFAEKVEQRRKDIFVGCAAEVQRSIREGSEITGAPGQPVDSSNLLGSWVEEFLSDTEWQTTTNVVYAPIIEAGVGRHGPLTLRSEVGGFGSVALTRAGWQAIVEHVAAQQGSVTLRYSLDTRRRA